MILNPMPSERKKVGDKLEIDWWTASLKLITGTRIMDEISKFDKDNIEEKIIINLNKFLSDPEKEKTLEVKYVENASTACKCLILWVKGIFNYFYAQKKIKPKREALKLAEERVSIVSFKLNEKREQYKKATDNLD